MNAITVDVEDWLQGAYDPRLPVTERFRRSTRRILQVLADRGVRGTFFVLGLAAEKSPELVREIQQAGHEVQSHGYGHRHVHRITPAEFREDLDRSRRLLEDITGERVAGYRAPAFTIGLGNLWALDVLVEAGFRYDCSIFPLKTSRYGIDGAPRYPHRLRTPSGGEIIEIPVASYRWCGRVWPTGGGGYFRLHPYPILRASVRQLHAAGHPAVIYFHPYEYDASEMREIDYPVPWRKRLQQGLGRRGFPRKIERLLSDFRFGRISDLLAEQRDLPVHQHMPS